VAKKKANRRANYQAPPPSAKAPNRAGAKVADTSTSVPSRPSRSQRHRSATLSWWLLGGGIVAVIALIVVLTSVLGEDQTGVTDREGWDLPALDADNDPDGDGRVTLAEFQGTPVVLNFFASWCVSCDRELPIFRQAVDAFGDDVQVLFINSNETGNWRPMVERAGIDDQILIDDIGGNRNNGLYRSLGGSGGLPLTAFYDAGGNVVDVFPGEFDANSLYSAIQSLTS